MNGELFKLFFKLGTLGFGGPAAHISMMREEVVVKRGWLGEEEFFDLVGAVALIPGPNSTELALHIGHKLAGWKGLIIAGLSFIIPAFLAVTACAYFYVQYGSLPDLSNILSGIRPVIVAIIAIALFNFRKSVVRNWQEVVLALICLIAAIINWNEILIIFMGGLLFSSTYLMNKKLSIAPAALFFFFLKIGSVLFGSGYVLLAFLKEELVDQKMWLTSGQLLDAITVGQITPGPVFTTATFVGYILQGPLGALVSTIGIFLPAFLFVAISLPYIPKLRSSAFFSQFLNGVNVASFSLMLLVTYELAEKSLWNAPTIILFLLSFSILNFTKLNSSFLIILGGLIGFFFF